jgi:AraC family transcriptional regulator, transcriptional activator of the genes for pyochelin and ferripyochelin receptors
MAVLFAAESFDQRWNESVESVEGGCYWDGVESIDVCPSWLGHGQRRQLLLGNSDSLVIEIRDESYQYDWSIAQHHEDAFPLAARFYLSGYSRVQTRGIANEYTEQAGQHYLYCLPNTEEIETYGSQERTHFVMIWLYPDRLRSLSANHITSLPLELQQFLEQDKRPFFHRSLGKTTSEMQQALQRLLHCPYQGLTRHLYLESQALELLSLQFAQWSEQDQTTIPPLVLGADDIERIHQAKAILAESLMHPPSITALARQVGLNDYKLKLGFRQVFETTPFGYLRSQRLDLAQQLLSDTELSVEKVAISVGYQSHSSFTAAFRRQFGTTPKVWQRQMSRRIV